MRYQRAIPVTANVVGLYPSIPHTEGLGVLRKQYDKFLHERVPTEDIMKMADFVLKNNFFKFNSKFFQQISGAAIDTKFAPHMLVFLWTTLKHNFLRHNQSIKRWVWKRFINDVLFIWTDSEEKLDIFKRSRWFSSQY